MPALLLFLDVNVAYQAWRARRWWLLAAFVAAGVEHVLRLPHLAFFALAWLALMPRAGFAPRLLAGLACAAAALFGLATELVSAPDALARAAELGLAGLVFGAGSWANGRPAIGQPKHDLVAGGLCCMAAASAVTTGLAAYQLVADGLWVVGQLVVWAALLRG